MSLSIFDVDGIDSEIIDENEIKTFHKDCGYGTGRNLEVIVGEFSKELCDNDAVVYFKLRNIYSGADWTLNMDEDKRGFELIFRGWESCNLFLRALGFAGDVLREARDRVMFQKEEKAF